MRTLKQIYYLVLLILLLAVVPILRLFGWRPKGETGIQTLFGKEPTGFAIVSGQETETEPYPYIYINADGSARELHSSEREYLQMPFLGADGARPYVKWRYMQKNGWGELTGFLKRTKVPRRVRIGPGRVDDPLIGSARGKQVQFLREKGFDISENNDGSYTATKSKMFRTEL
jgi:hypothetical protein